MQIARRFSRFTDSSECTFSDFSASVSIRITKRRMLLLPISRTVGSSYSISEAHSIPFPCPRERTPVPTELEAG